MAAPSSPRSAFVALLCAWVLLTLVGCAEYPDTRQEAALAEAERKRAAAAYELALGARAAGDAPAAANHLRDAAELGHARAAYELGLAYMQGEGVPEDFDLSATWINRAADLGDPGAEFVVGSSLYGGIGVEQNIADGLSFLERAADKGHPKAQFLLGQAYVDGVGVEKNAQWAARWYGQAAYGGHVQAQYALGVMFASGLGVPKSPRRAYRWLSIAAANGYEKAIGLRDQMVRRLASSAIAKADARVARFSARESAGYDDAPTIMFVQLRLRALGFDAGPVDGIAGPMTRAAIEAFQASERVKVDGKLSRALVEDLRGRGGPLGA